MAHRFHPHDITTILLRGDGDHEPHEWANSCDATFSARMGERSRHPPDGRRNPHPVTRRHAPDGWMGIMIVDCGYETLHRIQIQQDLSKQLQLKEDPVLASKVALWLTGRNEYGESVCLWIHHLVPYFYVGISHPDPVWAKKLAPYYAQDLLNYLRNQANAEHWRRRPSILDIQVVKRRWFYGYRSDPSKDGRQPDWASGLRNTEDGSAAWDGGTTQSSDWYLKVCAGAPYDVNKLRGWAADWVKFQGSHRAEPVDRWHIPVVNTTSTIKAPVNLTVFEANVEFALRCMIDLGLVGCGWCAFDVRSATPKRGLIPLGDNVRSRCQHEYIVDGRIFERAAMARDDALVMETDPWEAIHQTLNDPGAPTCLRFVARQDDLQRFVDGTGKGTLHPDPMEDWFQDLREATAPLTIMTFDIECCNNRGSFPQPTEQDGQVINLAARVYRLDRVEAYERARARIQQQAKTKQEGKEERGGNEGEVEDDLDGVDPTRSKWPPPFDAVALGLGTREAMLNGDMDGYRVDTYSFAGEREMLIAFARLVLQWDPDVIEGYNSVFFDMAYILRRAETLSISDVVWELGRLVGRKSTPKEQKFGNKAKGKRKEYRAHLQGRVQFDLMRVCFDDIALKLRSYKLNNVARELLNEGKIDLKYKLIPIKHRESDATRRELDEYCDADAVLPFKIERHQSYLMRYIELARVTGVPLRFLVTKGQQILVYTQILRKARQEAYAVPWLPVAEPERSLKEARKLKAYEGAVVINPKVGFYTIDRTGPVVVNDFNSLYPASMDSQNIGYITHITDPIAADACRRIHHKERDKHDEDVRKRDQWYDGELQVRAYEAAGGWKVAPVESKTRLDPVFVRPTVRRSLLAKILESLLAARGVAKVLMKKYPKGSAAYKVQDARQMALKVCCNSVYGFTGATVGRQPNLDISGATTGYGRKALYFTKRLAEEMLPGENDVVYGDSVTADTPVLCRYGGSAGRFVYRTIASLITPSEWSGSDTEKQRVIPSTPMDIWTDLGWTPIKQVIRHRVSKPIVRILTHTGCVDVTTDHSLLNEAGEKVKPRDVGVGSALLHTNLPLPDDTPLQEAAHICDPKTSEEKRAYVLGLFYADGSCGRYETKHGVKYSWAINKADRPLLETVATYLEDVYDTLSFKVLDTLKSSHVYKLVPVGAISNLVREFRPLLYEASQRVKKVPDDILRAPLRIRQCFWKGYYRGDDDKDSHGYIRCSNKGKIGAAGLYYLMRSIGYPVSVTSRRDKPNIFRLTGTRNGKKQRLRPNVIKKWTHFDPPPLRDENSQRDRDLVPVWVYDLETKNHHFAAGIGRLVVSNTDSTMVNVKDGCTGETPRPNQALSDRAIAAVKLAFERGKMLDDAVNARVIKPMRLETEKVYAPFLLVGRKKYMTLMWMHANAPYGIDAKGIEMVRRDNPHIVGMTCETFARLLMGKGPPVDGRPDECTGLWSDVDTAKELLRQVHRKMLEDDLPFEAYIISAKFSKPAPEYDAVPPHIDLAVRMQNRDPGSAPQLGNRIPYVLVRPEFTEAVQSFKKSALYSASDKRSVKVRDLAEDPAWAQEHDMRIDTDSYVERKFEPPFLRMLAPILAAPELAKGNPKDPGMHTRQRARHKDAPEKLQEWIQKKRQQNAEDIVRRELFADNYRHRKIRKTTHKDCAIERAFARKQTKQLESMQVSPQQPPQSIPTEEPDEKSAKERIQNLLDTLVVKSRALVETKRKGLMTGVPSPSPRAPSQQRSITSFFQRNG